MLREKVSCIIQCNFVDLQLIKYFVKDTSSKIVRNVTSSTVLQDLYIRTYIYIYMYIYIYIYYIFTDKYYGQATPSSEQRR